jgi:transketolase
MRQQFPISCLELVKNKSNVLVLLGDIGHFGFRNFETQFPNNFFNLGIAEQSLIGIASGLSSNGFIPIVHSIAPFVTERCFEQIKIDIGYQNQEVIIVSVGASFDYSHLGYTHHCPNDISLMRLIPNMDIYIPGSKIEFNDILLTTTGNGRPKYIKLHSDIHSQNFSSHKISKVNVGKDDNVIIFVGPSFKMMSKDFETSSIYYINTLTNLKEASIADLKSDIENKKVYVVEENNIIGGAGDMIEDLINKKVIKFGLPNKVIDKYGSYNEISNYLGYTKEKLIKLIYENTK